MILMILATGCSGPENDLRPGEVQVSWAGRATGGMRAAAEALVCGETGLVTLMAIAGDSAFGILFHPADSTGLPAGSYPVLPGGTDPMPRPGANLAVRWLDRGSMEVFEAAGGDVTVSSEDRGGRSGTFRATLNALERSDTLALEGRFRQVPLADAGPGCGTMMRRNRTGRVDG